MKPTEKLIQEHIVINLMLSIMLIISESIKANKVFYTNDVEKIVDFFLNYVDKHHRSKEENVFYPGLITVQSTIVHYPINSILEEHLTGKRYLNEIICCVENCKIGNTFSCERIADCMKNYVQLIENHIQNEENTLFPFANAAMCDNTQKQISEQFILIDKEFAALGESEKYDKLLSQMTDKYLH